MKLKKNPRRAGRGRTKAVGANVQQDFTPIFVGSKVVGKVCWDTFKKIIIGSKHLLRKPLAIAFDIASLHDAERAGARWVEVKDKETGIVYKVTIERIWEYDFKLNRGYGNQIALPLEYWLQDGHPKQMSMFE